MPNKSAYNVRVNRFNNTQLQPYINRSISGTTQPVGAIYSGISPATVGRLVKIASTGGNLDQSALTETDITTLQTDVGTNSTNIGDNTSRISDNEIDIVNLQTNVEDLDLEKLSLTGGTMSGNIDMGDNALFNLRTITGNGVDSVQILNGGQGLECFVQRARIQSVDNIELSAGVNAISLESALTMNNNDIQDVSNLLVENIKSYDNVADIVVQNTLNLSNNNITGVNNLSTLEVTSNGGAAVNFQDDIDMGEYEINNCNELRVSTISSAFTPDVNILSTLDLNNNDVENVGNLEVASINNLTPVGGIYSGISDGATISSSTFTDLLPTTSVGGLSVPADTFLLGSAFHLVCAGIFPSEDSKDDVEIELCAIQGATTIQLGLVRLDLENFDTEASNFELEADFIIRTLGVAAQVAVSFDFTFNKKVTKDFKGTRATNLATIDTTQDSTLQLNARIIGTNGSSIKSTLAYLRKQY